MATDNPKNRKVAIIGLEAVTATEIYSLFVSGRIRDVVLVGPEAKRLIGEFRELQTMIPLSAAVKLGAGTVRDCSSARVAVIGGSADRDFGTLAGLRKAVSQVRQTVTSLCSAGFAGIILVTGSPIELLVRAAVESSSFPSQKIFGIGNQTDLSSVVPRISDRWITPEEGASFCSETELPKGWCTAASSDVRYVDRCTADCPFFESLMAMPGVSAPLTGEGRDRSPQKLAACVTQICESVIDDLHTATPVCVSKDGLVESSVRGITRDGLENELPAAARPVRPRDTVADEIWSMVNAEPISEARCQ